jgi:hypothetical protein
MTVFVMYGVVVLVCMGAVAVAALNDARLVRRAAVKVKS